MRFIIGLFIGAFVYLLATPGFAQTSVHDTGVHETGVHETGRRPYPRPRPVVMPRLVESYAEVLRERHVLPLGAQIGACLGAGDRRDLDFVYVLDRPFGASSFTLRTFDASYHVAPEVMSAPGYGFFRANPDPDALSSSVVACLARVIRTQPLPAPYGMDSGANVYEARVTFTAPAPSRSRSSRRR